MGRIRKLDTQTANMIAAGEVVERPMGVVKELVENAIDAGSTRIAVSIEEGGVSRLTVSDNGCGMDAEDAKMAFERHATSKISKESDLWSIHTLGFRGEALPSIASVSKTTMCTGNGEESTRIVISYGKLESASAYPGNQGTEITVEGLFYHTPARLKHMRSASYEASLIQDVIGRFALSHPEIAFQLVSDGRETFRTSGQGDMLEVLYSVFGRAAAENAIPADFSDFDYKVNGYLVKPDVTRASRNQMAVFLNGRMVRTYRLYQSIREGYSDFIPKGRYPICALKIEMDPHLLDVNVHPSKWEVRLSKEKQLEYLLQDDVRKILHGSEPAHTAEPSSLKIEYYQPLSFDTDELIRESETENSISLKEENKEKMIQDSENSNADIYEEIRREAQNDEQFLKTFSKETSAVKEEADYDTETKAEVNPLPEFRLIGQYRNKWILAESDRGLAVIDQKKAYGRITFEDLLNRLNENPVMVDLLVPIMLEAGNIANRINELNEAVKDLHIAFEPFGNDTLLVHEIPSWLKDLDEKTFLEDLLDLFREEKNTSFKKVGRDRAARLAAAHTRGLHRSLSKEEMETLLKQLKKCQNPWITPDGKPVLVVLDDQQLAKELQ